jgi:hypothetical protein
MGASVFYPRRKHPIGGAADKRTNTQIGETQERDRRENTEKEITEQITEEIEGPLRDTMSVGPSTL